MKPWQRALAVLLLLVLIFAVARALSMVNEYYGSDTGLTESFAVVEKGTRYVPIPVSTLTIQSNAGRRHTLEVLSETSDKVKVGDRIDVVRSRGALGREWFQDRGFYEYLKGGRSLQGVPYVAVLLLFVFLLYKQLQVIGLKRRTAALSVPVALAGAFALFYASIAA